MSECKIKNRCTGLKSQAVCTQYEGEVNSQSSLINESCLNIEETTEDIYQQLEGMSTEGLGELCLTYTTEAGRLYVKNVLKKFEEKICELEAKLEEKESSICNTPISSCNFDFGTLLDECGEVPTTMGETIQLILNQINTP